MHLSEEWTALSLTVLCSLTLIKVDEEFLDGCFLLVGFLDQSDCGFNLIKGKMS